MQRRYAMELYRKEMKFSMKLTTKAHQLNGIANLEIAQRLSKIGNLYRQEGTLLPLFSSLLPWDLRFLQTVVRKLVSHVREMHFGLWTVHNYCNWWKEDVHVIHKYNICTCRKMLHGVASHIITKISIKW